MSDRSSRRDGTKRARSQRRAAWLRLATLFVASVLAGAAAAGTAAGQSMLEPAGRGAREVEDLWWLMFWIGAAIFVLVMLLLVFALFLRRSHDGEPGLSNRTRHAFVINGGIIMPFIVLAIVFGFTIHTLTSLAGEAEASDLAVEVVGHQFWWEVQYPDEEVVTANEIHIPVGSPVEFRMTSADVIHSFWVPELHGKIDLMPGTTTTITITAEETGRYRGQCAQFCGVQHANMAFYVVADEPDVFDAWLAHERDEAENPVENSVIAKGEEVFMSSACVYCHTVRGANPARAEIGPDLTHLMSRDTIAAGILENNQANLAGWIVDPQHIKPGNLMPAVDLTSEELQLLLAYLLSLD